MRITLRGVLQKWDGKQAVLSLDSGQEIRLQKSEMAQWADVGDRFVLTVLPEKEAALEQEDLARTLLNQILSHGEKTTS